ncbi:uncharacterized protein LOC129957588 [Argiope bruennichi]|uniref:uncharacterized protein LOC129957588 n=1 Tax=Argiope bruennichi TaxID=94029 RepID=UPI002493F2D0|nr:uncharacterized protein LOC129957588 [Argiope bruennichi]XP_055925976.1 uncharacterized protein LOC129957588 [Argiope bruennichi]
MNINKCHLSYVDSLPAFNKMLADPTKNVKDVYLPTPEVAAIVWDSKKEFIPQDTGTNIFLAAFTTAWARLKLYSEMDKLGEAVLYHDTDSIIYASSGDNDPPLGNFLGDFTDELDGDVITTFISGGPKNYAYETASGKTCCKVRGFTLNFKNSLALNFHSIKHIVCSLDRKDSILFDDAAKITRDAKRRKVFNAKQNKLYRMVYNKRVVKEDLSTIPYGF